MSNMELWNKVCKTDVDFTKEVSVGRKFTAIDAHYQVMRATEALGRAGEGWGFECVDKTFLPTDQIALTVRVWTGKRDNYIEHIGQCALYIDKKKTMADADCVKKAMTDGLTKCLSYFGFSADVFLGKFEDNKYVADLKQEAAKVTKEEQGKINDARVDKLYQSHMTTLQDATTKAEFATWWNNAETKKERAELKGLSLEKYTALNDSMKVINKTLSSGQGE